MPSQSLSGVAHEDKWPFDVWSEIVSYMGRSDLAHLCLVSLTFLSIFRPLLYRIILLDHRSSWIPTLDLLARDKALAGAVVQLDILECRELDNAGESTLNPLAIANLTSLRRFRFTCDVFRNKAEECDFWQILASKIDNPLEQLVYRPILFYPYRSWCGSQCGDLGGLKIVDWRPLITGKGPPHCFNAR